MRGPSRSAIRPKSRTTVLGVPRHLSQPALCRAQIGGLTIATFVTLATGVLRETNGLQLPKSSYAASPSGPKLKGRVNRYQGEIDHNCIPEQYKVIFSDDM